MTRAEDVAAEEQRHVDVVTRHRVDGVRLRAHLIEGELVQDDLAGLQEGGMDPDDADVDGVRPLAHLVWRARRGTGSRLPVEDQRCDHGERDHRGDP
jgi:hypothetical protein